MNRTEKIKLLDSVFNTGDLTGLKSLKQGSTVFVNLKDDLGEKRTLITDDTIDVFNYSFAEVEELRLRLLNEYNIVWLEQKTYQENERQTT